MLGFEWRYRDLMLELVKRDLIGQYRGSYGGVFWAVLEPLFMFLVYVTAFGFILQARWTKSGDTLEYAFMLFAGLIIFQTFSECLSRAPNLVAINPNYVKKIVFPLEMLPWVMCASVMVQLSISVALWIAGYIMFYGAPQLSVIYVPLILLAFLPMLLSVGWVLSAIGVFVKDIDHLTSLFSRALIFMTPVFYNGESVPEIMKHFLDLNPLTFIIDQFRVVLFDGLSPDFVGLIAYFCVGSAIAVSSLALFRKLRPAFADSL